MLLPQGTPHRLDKIQRGKGFTGSCRGAGRHAPPAPHAGVKEDRITQIKFSRPFLYIQDGRFAGPLEIDRRGRPQDMKKLGKGDRCNKTKAQERMPPPEIGIKVFGRSG